MTKPQVTRTGRTHKVVIGECTAYLIVNRDTHGRIMEVFAKSDNGQQGHLDMACRLISLTLQGRDDLDTIIKHMANDRTEPCGGPGQPTSIYDAIARVLRTERDQVPVCPHHTA